MTHEEYFKEFNGRFFEMGIPARLKRDALSLDDYYNFINRYSNCNLYTTVYSFDSPTDYSSAIVNRVFLEFDGEEKVFNEALRQDFIKFLSYIENYTDIQPQIFYSGNSGFHVVIHFDPITLFNAHKSIQRVVENFEALSGCRFLDLNANNGLSQMRRIPNSQHKKTGLYAVPLKPEEVHFFNCDEIRELARSPRSFWATPILSKDVPRALKLVDEKIEKRKLEQSLKPAPEIKEVNYDECTTLAEVLQGVSYGNRDFALVGLINVCRNKGWSRDETLAFVTGWHKENHKWEPKDLEWLEYKVDYHYPRNGKSCWWFKKAGFDYCDSCPIRKAMEAS